MTEIRLQEAPFGPARPDLPIHQQAIWTRLNRPGVGQRYLHFQAGSGSEVQGLVRLRQVAPGLSLAAIQRGPMTATPEALAQVLPGLERAVKAKGAVSLTVNPAWTGGDVAAADGVLRAAGYARVPQGLQNFPTTTAICDLTATEDGLMAAMTQTGRRHLRKAIKAGVTWRPMADAAEAALANGIMAKMAAETGLVTDSQHDFRPHFEYLSAHPEAGTCLVTELDGQVFGAAVNYVEGRLGYNMLIATRSDVSVPRAHGLMWASMLGLKALGCERFDMVGYPDPAIETDAGAAGRGAFKRAFGPEIVPVLPLYSKPLRPLLHGVLQKLRARRRAAKAGQAKAVSHV